ncbi:MAG: GGDEF domain-containing protein [Pirellulales bacterium]
MLSLPPIDVLVVASSEEESVRWRDALLAHSDGRLEHVWTANNTALNEVTPDVVFRASEPPAEFMRRLAALRPEPGVVSLGGANADLSLPGDATGREVVLACWLLGQIVRRAREQKPSEDDQLRRLAMTDALTGVGNRRAWDAELARHFERAVAAGAPLCIAIVDVDHFKSINEEWGHPTGDAALAELARALAEGVRENDFVARVGGDEFGLILPGLAPRWAAGVLDRIRTASNLALRHVVGRATSVSIGAAAAGQGGARLENLVARADEALRSAKQAGRDRVVFAPPDRL